MIAAVLFDLDDTLYDQRQWLDGAWQAVAARAALDGVDRGRLDEALRDLAADGSDRGTIIDRALARLGETSVSVPALVAAFRSHAPVKLDPYPGVVDALSDLHARVPLGLISDGDPVIQRAKLNALGLTPFFSSVVLSDEHGRAHRKPDPLPFRVALTELGVDARDAVYVGDRPAKDVAGAVCSGLRGVRVRTGEWHDEPDDPRAWATVDTVIDAIELIEGALPPAPTRETTSSAARP
jgi:putative hydrolase of the HAD superfamily